MNLPSAVQKLLCSILGPTGHSELSLRKTVADQAAHDGGAVRTNGVISGYESLPSFVEKVTHAPYKVVDSDITALKADGLSEDEIFELTVATAVGTGLGRMEKTLSLIEEAR